MKNAPRLLCLALLCLAAGCGADSLSRIAYGAADGLQRQTCMESPVARKQDCMRTEGYDEYQRKRQEAAAPATR